MPLLGSCSPCRSTTTSACAANPTSRSSSGCPIRIPSVPTAGTRRSRSSSARRSQRTAPPDSPASVAGVVAAVAVAAADLLAYRDSVAGCTKCALSAGRTQVVFGAGSPDAELMFVGEAPGFHEDKQGVPFVGAAGQLLSKLLEEIGLSRDEVYITNVLMCRPPGNRDPLPDEIQSCEPHLWHKIELIQPKLICTLGNFATKLLSGKPTGITQVHGQPQDVVLGGSAVTLYPIFHPAAALYTPRMLQVLQDDFARIPELLGRAAVPPPPPPAPVAAGAAAEQPVQLGLF